jgi:hypothetical protein
LTGVAGFIDQEPVAKLRIVRVGVEQDVVGDWVLEPAVAVLAGGS